MDIRREWTAAEAIISIYFDFEIKISFRISHVQFLFSSSEFNLFVQNLDSIVLNILEGEKKSLELGTIHIAIMSNGILVAKSDQTMIMDSS